MSADDRFKDADLNDVLGRLTVRARQLFATARAKGYANALARAGVDPDGLARSVIVAVLEDKTVKYRPSRGANLITFLSHVLENDFVDLIRKGTRLEQRLVTLDSTATSHTEESPEPTVVTDLPDGNAGARRIELRAIAMHAAKGHPELEDYVTAAFDCGAVTRRDQAELLGVSPAEITNRRKQLLKLLNRDAGQAARKVGGSDEA